jgi:hypothetical protein
MIRIQPLNRGEPCYTWVPGWLPPTDFVGPTQMPKLAHVRLLSKPEKSRSYVSVKNESDKSKIVVHGYLADSRLNGIWNNPQRYVELLSNCHSIIAPDFSICRGMPKHERIRSTWRSRAVCAFLQTHGLVAIPNIRWAELEDFDFVLEGVPKNSPVAISTQGLIRDTSLRQIFEQGCKVLVRELEPSDLVVYGVIPDGISEILQHAGRVTNVPTEVSRRLAERAI